MRLSSPAAESQCSGFARGQKRRLSRTAHDLFGHQASRIATGPRDDTRKSGQVSASLAPAVLPRSVEQRIERRAVLAALAVAQRFGVDAKRRRRVAVAALVGDPPGRCTGFV